VPWESDSMTLSKLIHQFSHREHGSGMPAYAKDGKVICFFRGDKNERYMTMGFSENANLDEGNMWPSSFALKN
jgi:uncharacterized protein YdhG (YjbR/CyaY superfamily)